MANPEHLEILEQGVNVWNKWRLKTGYITPQPDLSNADLEGLDFRDTDFSLANLSGANLCHSSLLRARLRGANLQGANLTQAHLAVADMLSASLHNANLEAAVFGETIFADTDLSNVSGLDSCSHMSPSTIDYRTLIKSGNLPIRFLRGCGLPDIFIEFLPSLLNDPLQFYSCFISYSSKNQLFTDRLYSDLQNKGVRCWLATEDLKIGDKTRIRIDESIRLHDKLLLVLSKHSVASDWVEQEVETALDRERREKRTVLFPIRLDDTVMKIDTGWPALIKNTRNIGDFRKWRNLESYNKAFERLLRDLKAEEK
jgi:hypothetical protein